MEKRIPPSSGLFHNAFRVVTNDKGLAPRRFTDSRIAVFDRSELYSVRARSSAGVALRFRLAAPTARIGYALERVHRGIPRADLFIDGAYAKTFELGPQDRDAEGSLEVASPSAEGAEIELVLPYQATFTLTGITLPEGGTVEPVQEPKGLFLFFGDSITQGQLAAHPSFAYGYRLSRLFGRSCRNFAVGGHVFDPDSLDPEIASLAPERIFVAYGTNDWSSGMDRGLFRARTVPPISEGFAPLSRRRRSRSSSRSSERTRKCRRMKPRSTASAASSRRRPPESRRLGRSGETAASARRGIPRGRPPPERRGSEAAHAQLAEIVSAGLLRPSIRS
jgi:hypothetical protein